MNEPTDLRTPRGAAVELVLRGELDIATRDEVLAMIDRALIAAPSELRLDLAAIDFIDCAGLSALLTAKAAAARRGCATRVVRMSAPVGNLAALTDTLDLLDHAARPHANGRPPQPPKDEPPPA